MLLRARPVGRKNGEPWVGRAHAGEVDLIAYASGPVEVRMTFEEAQDFALAITDSGHTQSASAARAEVAHGARGVTVQRGAPGARAPWFAYSFAPGPDLPGQLSAMRAELSLFAAEITKAVSVAGQQTAPQSLVMVRRAR